MVSVLLVTDDSVLTCGLAHILEESSDLRLTGVCAAVAGATETIRQAKADVVMIDVNFTMSLSFIADIRKSSPESRICLWGRCLPDEIAYAAMTAGIRGILRRTLPAAEVLECLRRLAADQVWFEERLMAGFFCNRAVRLTRRESQLIAVLAQGMKNKEIAYTLSLSEGTVKVYLSRLFEKLGVKDRFELALYGLRHMMTEGANTTVVETVLPAPGGAGLYPAADLQ